MSGYMAYRSIEERNNATTPVLSIIDEKVYCAFVYALLHLMMACGSSDKLSPETDLLFSILFKIDLKTRSFFFGIGT